MQRVEVGMGITTDIAAFASQCAGLATTRSRVAIIAIAALASAAAPASDRANGDGTATGNLSIQRLDFASHARTSMERIAMVTSIARSAPVQLLDEPGLRKPEAIPVAPIPATHVAAVEIAYRLGSKNRPGEEARPSEPARSYPPVAGSALVAAHEHQPASGPPTPAMAAPAEPKAPAVRLQLTKRGNALARAAFPFDLGQSTVADRGSILVGRLPEGVTFSAGHRTGLGLWQIKRADARLAEIIVGPSAPAQFDLTFMLLDGEGTVTNGLEVAIAIVQTKDTAARSAKDPAPKSTASQRGIRTADEVRPVGSKVRRPSKPAPVEGST